MYNRSEIEHEVASCLGYAVEESAQRHLEREAGGWRLGFGYWPMNIERNDIGRAVIEISNVLHMHVVRRNMQEQDFQIDACSIGYQQLHVPNRTARLVGGVGLWFPGQQDLTTEVE